MGSGPDEPGKSGHRNGRRHAMHAPGRLSPLGFPEKRASLADVITLATVREDRPPPLVPMHVLAMHGLNGAQGYRSLGSFPFCRHLFLAFFFGRSAFFFVK